MSLRRPEFEKAYAESHDRPLGEIEQLRMGDTYRDPLMAKCWRFWQMALESTERAGQPAGEGV